MKVSIIVPVYKAEKYLDKCISSLISQTYQDIEVILVDDGSPDNCPRMCDLWAERDKRIKVSHIQNHGVSYARNCGLDLANGDYIAFCDSDDYYAPEYIVEMVNNAEEKAADILICGYYYINKDQYYKQQYDDASGKEVSRDELVKHIFLNNEIGGFVWNKLFRKCVIDGVRFCENVQICEDTYFVFQCVSRAKNIYYYAKPLYYYRLSNSSAVGDVNNICSENHRSKYTEIYECILQEFELSEVSRRYIMSGICMLSISVKCDYLISGGKDILFLQNLNHDAKKYLNALIFCKEISFKKKIVTVGNWLFNLRKLKCKVKL